MSESPNEGKSRKRQRIDEDPQDPSKIQMRVMRKMNVSLRAEISELRVKLGEAQYEARESREMVTELENELSATKEKHSQQIASMRMGSKTDGERLSELAGENDRIKIHKESSDVQSSDMSGSLDDKPINLIVKSQHGSEIAGFRYTKFKVKMSSPLGRLMDAYCVLQAHKPGSIRFLFDGQRLQLNASPESYEMEDEDIIDAMIETFGS
eukprot:170176_1